MTNSMTAFARYEIKGVWGSGVWEIRSLNQRYLDICLDLPKHFSDLSWIIRKKIKGCLIRGRIECSLQLYLIANQSSFMTIDENLVSVLSSAAKKIRFQVNGGKIDPVKILLYPGVISYKQDRSNMYDELCTSFERTLTQLLENRKKEGNLLSKEITDRLFQMSKVIDNIRQFIPKILCQKKKKLMDQVQSVCSNVDSIRLEQELLIITQKMDIAEEIDRLVIHVQSMYSLLSETGSVGRKLNFLVQELQREANTITAKSIDIDVIYLAISLKVLIEQVREQIQNIE